MASKLPAPVPETPVISAAKVGKTLAQVGATEGDFLPPIDGDTLAAEGCVFTITGARMIETKFSKIMEVIPAAQSATGKDEVIRAKDCHAFDIVVHTPRSMAQPWTWMAGQSGGQRLAIYNYLSKNPTETVGPLAIESVPLKNGYTFHKLYDVSAAEMGTPVASESIAPEDADIPF